MPGKALLLGGPGQHVNFDEILGGTRSISFWIKPVARIDSTNVIERPIFVRAQAGPGNFSTGQFAIYFGKTGTSEAGNLVFLRATENTSHQIKSDSKTWIANQWYHVAAVLHPQNGMQLFVNGVLQQDAEASTDPVYLRNEGPTGPVFLGKWGNVGGYGITAEFDELRFYDFAVGEVEVRTGMCRTVSSGNLKGYYNFDNASSVYIPTTAGTVMGLATGLSASSIINSNAPVGEQSNFLYNFCIKFRYIDNFY